MLNKRVCLLLSVLLGLFILASVAIPAFAGSIDEKRQERDDLEERLKQERSALDQQRNRESSLQAELDQLDRRLNKLREELASLAGEIKATEEKIVLIEEELADAEAQLEYQEDLLKSRMRAIYERGNVTYLEVLLGATSFSDFINRFNNLKLIIAYDQQLVEEIRAERDRVQSMRDELEEQRNELEAMRRQVLASEAEMERTAASRGRILEELREEIARNEKAIADLEREAQELNQIIRQLILQSGDLPGLSGKMHFPMEPPLNHWFRNNRYCALGISSFFGWRTDPIQGHQAWHGAIDIVPYLGRENYIVAAEFGRVIFSGVQTASGRVNLPPGVDRNRSGLIGYGSHIMIDHGDNYVTLYSHLSSRVVGLGEYVEKGQRIGRAGTTGYSTGVHLHFEVWDYNRPPPRSTHPHDYRQDPLDYLLY